MLYNDKIFKHVNILYNPVGSSVISWIYHENFKDPTPYNITLQKSKDLGNPSSWVDIAFGTNVFSLTDPDTAQLSKGFDTAYRLKLETPVSTYFSPTAQSYQNLTYKQWNIYRAILRRHFLVPKHLKKYNVKVLKRKRSGIPCSCLDPDTKLVLNSDCATCFGTGIEGGFWKSDEHFVFMISPDAKAKTTAESQDLMRGTIYDELKVATLVGLPFVDYGDILVNTDSNFRYFVHDIKTTAEFSMVPINYLVKIMLLPPTHPVYLFEV